MFKKWILLFALVFIGLTVAIGFFNYKADPFGYWASSRDDVDHLTTYGKAAFGRKVKSNYIRRNPQKYSAVIFGGSNAGVLDPDLVNQLTGYKTYNYWNATCSSKDYRLLTAFCIKTMPNLKQIMIQLSNGEFFAPLDDPQANLPKYISGEDETLEKLSYIFFSPLKIIEQHNKNIHGRKIYSQLVPPENKNPKSFMETTIDGKWEMFYSNFPDEFIFKNVVLSRAGDPLSFDAALEGLFTGAEQDFSNEDTCIEDFVQIKRMCDENGIKLTVWTAPCFISKKVWFEGEQYYLFLRRLVQITDVWDFSGFYDANLNPYNFHDVTHFNDETADEILKIVLGGKQNPVFGEHLSAQNIDQAIARRRTAFEALKAEYELTGTVHLFDKVHESYFRREGE